MFGEYCNDQSSENSLKASVAAAFLACANNVEIIQQGSRRGPWSTCKEIPMDQWLYSGSKGHCKEGDKKVMCVGGNIQSTL